MKQHEAIRPTGNSVTKHRGTPRHRCRNALQDDWCLCHCLCYLSVCLTRAVIFKDVRVPFSKAERIKVHESVFLSVAVTPSFLRTWESIAQSCGLPGASCLPMESTRFLMISIQRALCSWFPAAPVVRPRTPQMPIESQLESRGLLF